MEAQTDPKSALQPYLNRLTSLALFESYYISSSTLSSAASTISTPLTSSSPVLVVLSPYAGSNTLTEGLDWEAEQGEKAFWEIMGPKDDVEEGNGFFDKTEADEQGDEADEL